MSSTNQENTWKLLSTPALKPKLSKEAVDDSLFSVKHQLHFSGAKSEALSLTNFLREHLPHIDPESWSERAQFGGLYINGKRVSLERTLEAECIVEYYEPKYAIEEAKDFYPRFDREWIVYEDEYLAIVFKPEGLPTQPNKEQSGLSLRQYLEKHYKRKVHLPSRLDTATAGLIVCSIHESAHEKAQRLFERRLITKHYLCEIEAEPSEASYRIDAPITRSELHAVLREVSIDEGDRAITDITILEKTDGRALVRARPITGRTHQIRVHLASFLGPIIGDNFYGGPRAKRLSLLSESVSFFHPFTEQELSIHTPTRLYPEWLTQNWNASALSGS